MASRLAAALLMASLWPAAAGAEPDAARQAELRYLLEQDCGSCHGLTLKGGLGLPLRPEALAEKTDEALVAIILDGIPGTPMPPWRPLLSPEEAEWLVKLLRKGR
jgi:cytochrome c55X